MTYTSPDLAKECADARAGAFGPTHVHTMTDDETGAVSYEVTTQSLLDRLGIHLDPATIVYTAGAEELVETLNRWPEIPAGGSPLDTEPDRACPDVCPECGGRGLVYRPNAICYANEQDAEMACPSCCPSESD